MSALRTNLPADAARTQPTTPRDDARTRITTADPARLSASQTLQLAVLALLLLGVLMVTSAGMRVGQDAPQTTLLSILTSRYAVHALLALAAMAAATTIPVRSIIHKARSVTPSLACRHRFALLGGWSVRSFWLPLILLAGVLLLVYVPGVRRPMNGANRWITLGVPGLDSVQPSEVAKWVLPVLLCWYAVTVGTRISSFRTGLLPALCAVALICGIIAIEDLGTAVLIGATAATLLIAAGARFWHFLAVSPIAIGAVSILTYLYPYRMERVFSFFNPYADPEGAGFHMIQSMVAVSNGEIFGRGLGHGLQKFGYLPEDKTDFIFAIICEELGVVGAGLTVMLLVTLLISIHLIARNERNTMLRLFALAVMTTIALQSLINLAVVLGLGPTKGIALPLVSAGGTGWIMTALCLGVIAGYEASRRNKERLTPAAAIAARSATQVPAAHKAVFGQICAQTLAAGERNNTAEHRDRWW